MFDILFAIALSAFLVIEGFLNESDTVLPFRMILVFVLLPLSAVMSIIEFIFWGGDNILLIIIAAASFIAIIGFIITVRLSR